MAKYSPCTLLRVFWYHSKYAFHLCRHISKSSHGKLWLESLMTVAAGAQIIPLLDLLTFGRGKGVVSRTSFKNWWGQIILSVYGMFGINISGMNSSPSLQTQITPRTRYTAHFMSKYNWSSLSSQIFSPQDILYNMCAILNRKSI